MKNQARQLQKQIGLDQKTTHIYLGAMTHSINMCVAICVQEAIEG